MAVCGLWQSVSGSGKVLGARRLSDRLLRLTADKADDELRLQAHHSAWTTWLFAGDPAAAREHCEAGRRLYDPDRQRYHRLLYGGDGPGVCAGSLGAVIHWLLGYPDKGLALGSEALAMAERIAHPFSVETALLFYVILHLECGEPDLALQRLEAAETLVAEQRLAFLYDPRFFRGAALSAQGAFEEAAACLREGLTGSRGPMFFRPYGLARLAEALARQGEHRAALAVARDALKLHEKTRYGYWDAELHRLEGIALLGLNLLDQGQSALQEALRIARGLQAKAYELRAATGLARLWGEQGRRAKARELLAPICGWYTEGLDTADLKDAKALLDRLI
jgi:predicted ATPase